jgi:hypothetical protein
MELLIARNPDPDSRLPYLLRLPLGDGLVFRAKATWPRENAVFCHQAPISEWPDEPELVERIPLRSCTRRGASIDVLADRGREQRSQIVYTRARGRDVVFWQSPRTRKQSRPNVRTPTARASGLAELEIIVDSHERYPYAFSAQQVTTSRRGLRCGDYAVVAAGRVVAAVERKSLQDLVSSVTSGKLRFAVGELATLPRAAIVVEDRYARLFELDRVRPAVVADALAELQIRWPGVPLVFCDSRKLAEEWTYRYLAAAWVWADAERTAGQLTGTSDELPGEAEPMPTPSTAELRKWAMQQGLPVADRGRLRPEVLEAWRTATAAGPSRES